MLYEEAQWVGNELKGMLSEGEQLLNLGSSTLHSRTIAQPHMHEFIFHELDKKGIRVIHCDIAKDEGVDLQGDFTDPKFIEQLKQLKFDGVICCNLLEHLEERSQLVNCLNEIVPAGGVLLVTVPKQYPYHLDPIDTMYRPSPEEIINLFPQFEVVESSIVLARRQVKINGEFNYHKNYFDQLKSDPKLFARLFLRSLLPFYKYHSWRITVNDLKSMFRPFSVSCVIMKRKSGQ